MEDALNEPKDVATAKTTPAARPVTPTQPDMLTFRSLAAAARLNRRQVNVARVMLGLKRDPIQVPGTPRIASDWDKPCSEQDFKDALRVFDKPVEG